MMFSASLVSAALFVAGALAQSTVMINTPENVVVCQPTLLTFSGGTPPYILSILPGGQPSAPPLEQYTGLTGSSFTWNANIQGGSQVGLTLRDSTGASGQSAPFPINAGGDTSCLSQPSGGPASGGASGSGGSSTPASTPSSGSSGSSTPSVTSPSTTPSSTPTASTPSSIPSTTPSNTSNTSRPATSSPSTAAPSPTTTPSSAGALSASLGFAGLVGAAVVAILA